MASAITAQPVCCADSASIISKPVRTHVHVHVHVYAIRTCMALYILYSSYLDYTHLPEAQGCLIIELKRDSRFAMSAK